jgi:hypothetical protein
LLFAGAYIDGRLAPTGLAQRGTTGTGKEGKQKKYTAYVRHRTIVKRVCIHYAWIAQVSDLEHCTT